MMLARMALLIEAQNRYWRISLRNRNMKLEIVWRTQTEITRFLVAYFLSMCMKKLEDVDGNALRDALEQASSAKATKRLMIALAYADGVRVEALSKRYNIPHATVYSWLDRFEHQSISEALEDKSRSGRPSKLTASQRERLFDDLAGSPAEIGYDASEWISERVQSHIEQTYGVIYSLGHVRRLLRELPAST